MSKLVFGCGYLGLRVAAGWRATGHELFAMTRSVDRAAKLEQQGLRAIIGDVASRQALAGKLPVAETVLYAIGYDPSGGRTREEVQIDGLRNVLNALPADTGRIIFISTTGVYGQTSGQWIDEETLCEPT